MLQYDVKAISRKFFGHEVFLAERSLNQPKASCVCIRSINQSNRSISVLLLFLFCSRVFISRSYENRSIKTVMIMIIMTVITIIINCTENRTIFFFEVLEELVVIEENKKIYLKSVYKLAEWVFLIHFSVTGRIV